MRYLKNCPCRSERATRPLRSLHGIHQLPEVPTGDRPSLTHCGTHQVMGNDRVLFQFLPYLLDENGHVGFLANTFARHGRYEDAESSHEILKLLIWYAPPEKTVLAGMGVIRINCPGPKRIDQMARCCRDGSIRFPGDPIQRLSGDYARLGAGGFHSNDSTEPNGHCNCSGRNNVSLPRYSMRCDRRGGGEYTRGAKMGRYQVDQHTTTTPRKPIRTSYPLLDCPCTRRQAVRSCLSVGQTSLNITVEEILVVPY